MKIIKKALETANQDQANSITKEDKERMIDLTKNPVRFNEKKYILYVATNHKVNIY